MKLSIRLPILLAIGLLVASGCSALPGLRVLTGQDSPDALADQVAELTDMVMADKSGTTDPSVLAAADRIEQASGDVDIVEIRQDTTDDLFTVYMLLQPPGQNTTQQQYVESVRRAIELTWQGTMQASQGSDLLKVVILAPMAVPTMDKGLSFAGSVNISSEIARSDAVAYLAHRPNSINDFINLIALGKMTVDQPDQANAEFYAGQPNHPVFMLAQLEAQIRAQQGQASQ
jgi:predicted amino acid-binding ACT domain protein